VPEEFLIDSGQLRQRVEIQRNTTTKDAKGQPINGWTTIAERWAAVLPASGQFFVASEQIRNSTSHKIVMRYFDGLTPKDRIKLGSRIFNVLSVIDESSLKVRHTILATEVIA
jgi:SPP1 family predicted phage head-tail adaptor